MIVPVVLLALPGVVSAASVEYVIHISVDGLRADLLETLIETDTTGTFANFKRFLDEGATTFNARTDFTHTNTLPNHTSMLTGRPVLQPAGQPNTVHHGYTSNTQPCPGDTLHNQGNPNLAYIASVFDVAHDNGLCTAQFASKSKFVIFEQGYNAANGAPDTTGPNDGPDKIDTYVNLSSGSPSKAAILHAAFIADMSTNHYNYSFVHYRDPDSAGHASGWGSAAWRSSVAAVDGYLGGIFDLIENDGLLAGRTAVILSADHGGTGFGHGNPGLPANYTIPFFVWGSGITAADLYALNATTRLDPGTGRTDYNSVPQPIRNGDGGNLALDLLGLGSVAGSTINAGQDLAVGQCPPDLDGDGRWQDSGLLRTSASPNSS
ncbi:MAG: alkaline phosphatase family protein [Planctomycetes bacterium]|nr:alkaline phosphatase family protein [Planctomycetota bacterium]